MACRRRHIRRLALFGSVLREDFGPASDIDVLVEFEPGHVPKHPFRDDHIERAFLDSLHRRRGIAGADDLVADSFQAVTNPLPVIRVAVDEKNAGHNQG